MTEEELKEIRKIVREELNKEPKEKEYIPLPCPYPHPERCPYPYPYHHPYPYYYEIHWKTVTGF